MRSIGDDKVQYLSSAKLDTGDWDFVAFTQKRVIRVLATQPDRDEERFETVTFARSSLQSLELLDVEGERDTDRTWPSNLNVIGHYSVGSVPLPLDKFASQENKRDLKSLLGSLLEDVAH